MHSRLAIACLLLLLAGCTDGTGDGDMDPGPDTGPTTHDVAISGFAFAPKTLEIHAGDTVRWTNNDQTTHTVSGFEDAFLSGDLAPGAVYSQTFTAAGTFDYRCDYHPSMNGIVTVV